MADKKPTLVFVHGSWHRPEHMALLRDYLQAKGYPTLAVDLPSNDDSMSEPKNLSDDTFAVRSAIKAAFAANTDAVVIAHSYGGAPASNAVAGFDAASQGAGQPCVRAMVFISAFVVPPKSTIIAELEKQNCPPVGEVLPAVSESFATVKKDPGARHFFYHDLSVEESAKYEALLRPQSVLAYADPMGIAVGHESVESWYLFCEEDNALPMYLQKGFYERSIERGGKLCEERCKSLKSSHSPFLSMVEETAGFIERAAGNDEAQVF